MFTVKFYKALLKLVTDNIDFVCKLFEKLPRDKINEYYQLMFTVLLDEYKMRLSQDYLATANVNSEIFNSVVLTSLQKLQVIVVYGQDKEEV